MSRTKVKEILKGKRAKSSFFNGMAIMALKLKNMARLNFFLFLVFFLITFQSSKGAECNINSIETPTTQPSTAAIFQFNHATFNISKVYQVLISKTGYIFQTKDCAFFKVNLDLTFAWTKIYGDNSCFGMAFI